jgi:hypothetical protein
MADENLKKLMQGIIPKERAIDIQEELRQIKYDMLQAQKLHNEGDKIMSKVWERLNKITQPKQLNSLKSTN